MHDSSADKHITGEQLRQLIDKSMGTY